MVAEFDQEGFLKNLEQWTPALAEKMAKQLNIQLAKEHWFIINNLRSFYHCYQLMPNMRVWIKWIHQHRENPPVSTLHLTQLFSDQPLKTAAKIAGLPKPRQCT